MGRGLAASSAQRAAEAREQGLSRHWGYRGHIGIMEKKMETTIVCWGYIGIMEKKMETTIVYWGYIGIMEKKMETTI